VLDNEIALNTSILSALSKLARGISSAFPVSKKVSFNTSELICPVTSLSAAKLRIPAIEMLTQQVNIQVNIIIV